MLSDRLKTAAIVNSQDFHAVLVQAFWKNFYKTSIAHLVKCDYVQSSKVFSEHITCS